MIAISPGRRLLVGALASLVIVIAMVFAATRAPWLGLQLAPPTEVTEGARPSVPGVKIVATRGPAAAVPRDATLLSVASLGGAAVPIGPADLIDEPDYFDRYPEMDAFFARQSEIHRVVSGDRVVLEVQREGGAVETFVVQPAPRRPLSTLPRVFWFQLCAGSIGLLVSLWVLVLRPGVRSIQMFALAGVMILGFSAPAAVYSTRELAMDGGFFRVLSAVNHLCANLFGLGLVGIFVTFPRALVRPRLLWLLPAIILPWWALDATRLAPDQNWGARAPIMLEMLSAIVFAIVQWVRAKGDARARASLRWFGVCVLTGASFFVFSVVGTTIFGVFPPIPQGYSFGFFLLMHVGLALGLRQTRLFELNELAYVVLFYVVGAIALVALDAAVLLLLDTSHLVASAVALFAIGLAYVPVRSWVWSKATSKKKIDDYLLFRRVIDAVFATSPEVRARKWNELFEALFSPLEIQIAEAPPPEVTIHDDGLVMTVPSVATLPALKIAFPWRGSGLFGERHVKLTLAILQLAEHAENARDAFDRGVREERARVARDLHDDVGAVLTSALYQQDPDGIRQSVTSALQEMRSMINQLTGRRVRLADVVGELRHEALDRLGAAGVAPAWPLADLGATTVHSSIARNYSSMVREITSNVLRHSGARTMTVDITLEGTTFVTTISDDGKGFDEDAPREGNGLQNIRRRTKEIGGRVTFSRRDGAMAVRLEMPIDRERA